MAPIVKNAVQKTMRLGGFGRAVLPPRESLTQQFFLEGERQEAEGWKDVPLPADVAEVDPELAFDSFDRVPRRHRVLKTFLALGLSATLAGLLWTVGKPFLEGAGRQAASDVLRRLGTAATGAPPPEARAEIAAAGPAPTIPARPLAATPGSPAPAASATEPPAALQAAGPPSPAAPELSPPPAASAGVPSPPPTSTVTARQAPRAPFRSPRGGDEDGVAQVHRRAIRVMPVQQPAPGGDSQPQALRGFVWSPSAKALLPVESVAPTAAPERLEVTPPAFAEPVAERPAPEGAAPAEPAPAPREDPHNSAPILDP